MKLNAVALLLFVAAYAISSSLAANIWNSVPPDSGTDAQKFATIYTGVVSARNWLAGQICTSTYFQNCDDSSVNQNWAGFLCTLWGGPAGTGNCTYFYQNIHDVNTSLVIDPSVLPQYMSLTHLSANLNYFFSDTMFNMTRDALVYGIYYAGAPGSTLAFQTAALNDLETLRGNIVQSPQSPCPVAAQTINWAVASGNVGTATINPGSWIVWKWNDGAPHSIFSKTVTKLPSTFQFVGFGGGTKALSTGTICTASGAPCVLLGTGFSYAYQFNVPCSVVNYNCSIHSTLIGTISVKNVNGTSCIVTTSGSTSGAVGDGTGLDGPTGSSQQNSGAGVIVSWLSAFF